MDVYSSTSVCLLLLFQLLYPSCSTTQECLTGDALNKLPSVDGRMNVLLQTLPISGNLAPLLACLGRGVSKERAQCHSYHDNQNRARLCQWNQYNVMYPAYAMRMRRVRVGVARNFYTHAS